MTPEQVRAAGIYLNGGRRRGWKRGLSALLDTPPATISAWSTRSRGNARPIPGVAAVAIKLLVAMMRQELMVTAHPGQAGEALAARLEALLRRPDQMWQRSITIDAPAPVPPTVQPPLPRPDDWRVRVDHPEVLESPLPFGIKEGGSGSQGGRPGSSVA
ncbi:MAG TPA: hypothetical protein VFV80_06855 [Geminicoccaceae bacterium]|nr:hypothetical protein [Geminicoccaceae bacterium]